VKEELTERKNTNFAIASDNNHYVGFYPCAANIFRKMVGLQEVAWGERKEKK
jgi:hypothetical protein